MSPVSVIALLLLTGQYIEHDFGSTTVNIKRIYHA